MNLRHIQPTRRPEKTRIEPPASPRAFTLIELLVVVAIIATLLAILLPSLRHAYAHAKRVKCAANLRQIAAAWQLYLDDHDGRLLWGDNWYVWNVNVNFGGQQGAGGRWYEGPKPLNPYLGLSPIVGELKSTPSGGKVRTEKAGEVFRCPADKGGDNIVTSVFDHHGTSYQTNIFLIGTKPLNWKIPGDPLNPIYRKMNARLRDFNISNVTTSVNRLLLVADYGWYSSINVADPGRFDWHSRRSAHNLGFLDGHVRFTRIRKGLHVTEDYITIPFSDLAAEAAKLQIER